MSMVSVGPARPVVSTTSVMVPIDPLPPSPSAGTSSAQLRWATSSTASSRQREPATRWITSASSSTGTVIAWPAYSTVTVPLSAFWSQAGWSGS